MDILRVLKKKKKKKKKEKKKEKKKKKREDLESFNCQFKVQGAWRLYARTYKADGIEWSIG